jgi:hypothetical protein
MLLPASSVAVHVAVFVPVVDVDIPVTLVETLVSRLSVATHVPVIVPPTYAVVTDSEKLVIFGAVLSTQNTLDTVSFTSPKPSVALI